MKKRPFKKKLEYRAKHPYPFKRLKFVPTKEFVDALGFIIRNEGIQIAPAPPNLIEYRHQHGVKFRGLIPQIFHDDEDDSCPRCECCSTEWVECWKCGGEGGRDGEELMAEDPLWYMPDDFETCDICNGNGGWNTCLGQCDENGKHESHENNL